MDTPFSRLPPETGSGASLLGGESRVHERPAKLHDAQSSTDGASGSHTHTDRESGAGVGDRGERDENDQKAEKDEKDEKGEKDGKEAKDEKDEKDEKEAKNALEDNDEEDEIECRICRDVGSAEAPLVWACECRGAIGAVHLECLRRWVEMRPANSANAPNSGRASGADRDREGREGNEGDGEGDSDSEETVLPCEVCRAPFRVAYDRAVVWDTAKLFGRESLRLYGEAAMLSVGTPIVLFLHASWLEQAAEESDEGRSDGDPDPDPDGDGGEEFSPLPRPTRVLMAILTLAAFILLPVAILRILHRWRILNSTACLRLRHPRNGNAHGIHQRAKPTIDTAADAAVDTHSLRSPIDPSPSSPIVACTSPFRVKCLASSPLWMAVAAAALLAWLAMCIYLESSHPSAVLHLIAATAAATTASSAALHALSLRRNRSASAIAL